MKFSEMNSFTKDQGPEWWTGFRLKHQSKLPDSSPSSRYISAGGPPTARLVPFCTMDGLSLSFRDNRWPLWVTRHNAQWRDENIAVLQLILPMILIE